MNQSICLTSSSDMQVKDSQHLKWISGSTDDYVEAEIEVIISLMWTDLRGNFTNNIFSKLPMKKRDA